MHTTKKIRQLSALARDILYGKVVYQSDEIGVEDYVSELISRGVDGPQTLKHQGNREQAEEAIGEVLDQVLSDMENGVLTASEEPEIFQLHAEMLGTGSTASPAV